MVRRYIGDYSVETLKTFPTVGLDQILTPDKDRGVPASVVGAEATAGIVTAGDT